jgi:hypothetical protein
VPSASVIVTAPASVPIAVGVKVIEIVQLLRAASEFPQVLLSAKFVLAEMAIFVSAAVPLFVRRTVVVPLVALTAIEPKVCDVAESVAV